MPITAADLSGLNSFEDLATLFNEKLEWPKPEWRAFAGVATLYDLDAEKDIPGVVSLKAVEPLADDQSWGIFLVDFGGNELKRTALRGILNKVTDRARPTHGNPTWLLGNILFICRSQDDAWTLAHFRGDSLANAKLRTFGWEDPHEARTALENLNKLHWLSQSDWDAAWNIEGLTKAFFQDYRLKFEAVELKMFAVIPNESTRRRFVQALFNRLMFLCFLQRKQWLDFQGERKRYLFAMYDGFEAATGERGFYDRLRKLFFSGLNSPNGVGGQDNLEPLIGRVPFLNGGLFEPSPELDKSEYFVPDEVFRLLLASNGLFQQYNFTVTEATPLDEDVAIDPEMLGKVFEELVIGRHASGSYYTPRQVVSYMCREAIKCYLGGHDDLVDKHDTNGIDVQTARQIVGKLESITVCDPACGSGAYLLGMLQEIHALQVLLDTTRRESQDPEEQRAGSRNDYERKLTIIENCLYGVDIDPFAVGIAWLRLWLALVIDDQRHPLDHQSDNDVSLPNLDVKIEVGDSLLGQAPFDVLASSQLGFAAETIRLYRTLKGEYIRAHEPDSKLRLRTRLKELRQEIRTWLKTDPPNGAFDWVVSFVEVFLDGDGSLKGFDVVLANPPYISAIEFGRKYPETYRRQLNKRFQAAHGAYDIYVLFFEQSLRLLCKTGSLAFITPNKYLSAPYAVALRKLIHESGTLDTIVNISQMKIFTSVMVYPVLTFIRNGASRPDFVNVLLPEAEDSTAEDVTTFTRATARYDSLALLPDLIWGFLLSRHVDLLERIVSGATRLDQQCSINATTTASEADIYSVALVEQSGCPDGFKVVNTGTIDPYVSIWGRKHLTSSGQSFLTPVLPRTVPNPRRAELYTKPKILFAKLGRSFEGFVDRDGEYAGVNINCLYEPRGFSLDFLAGFVHSTLFHFLYEQFFGSLRMAGGYLQFQAPQLRVLPFRLPTNEQEEEVHHALQVLEQAEGLSRFEAFVQIDDVIFDIFEVQFRDRQYIRTNGLGIVPGLGGLPAPELTERQEFFVNHRISGDTLENWRMAVIAEAGTILAEIRALLAPGHETETLEFKSSFGWDMNKDEQADWTRDEVHVAICALLNAQGGELLIGVDDATNILGLDKDLARYGSKDKLVQAIEGALGSTLRPNPIGLVKIEPVDIDGKSIVRVRVKPDNTERYRFKEQIYVRRNSKSKPALSADEAASWWPKRQRGEV